ncbi:hypothetical protein VP01_8338g2 [Puccinia sorghi]|uniref:Uncharacterized protein n=1 Tax=Puccinia sorghi TaxID=27349 RepID=A0A0L6U9R0_9BASI|nr:hypothetical protein VP01_8338g2 [Puccinia sorghi]
MTSNRSAARPATTSETRPSQGATDKSDAPPTTLEKAPALAAHDLRMIVNVLDSEARGNPTATASTNITPDAEWVLEFDNKCNYFSQKLHKARSCEQYGNMQLNVRRPV